MKLERPLCSLDLEGTSTDPTESRIVEFAAEVLHPDGRINHFCQRFNPGVPIPPGATEVHGITNEMVKDCPPFKNFATKILAGLRGKDLLGYNLRSYDLVVIDEEARRCGMKLDLSGVRIIDAFGIFTAKEPRDLSAAVKFFCDREHDGAHGAAADAAATMDVFMGQWRRYEDLRAMSLEELDRFSRRGDKDYVDLAGKLYRDAEGFVCYAFGKPKDKRVKDDPGFARWVLGKDGFAGSAKDALREELGRLGL